jgi:cell division protein FtsB
VAVVIDLKTGGETVETIARSELGLIKEGEIFYQIVE